jgi:DNA-binding MarR family transcriptional regulator
LILFNIGEDVLSVGELTNWGYYLGSNVSNVKKLVENGYLARAFAARSRTVHVRLSPKALQVCQRMHEMYDRRDSMKEVASQSDLNPEAADSAPAGTVLDDIRELRLALILSFAASRGPS